MQGPTHLESIKRNICMSNWSTSFTPRLLSNIKIFQNFAFNISWKQLGDDVKARGFNLVGTDFSEVTVIVMIFSFSTTSFSNFHLWISNKNLIQFFVVTWFAKSPRFIVLRATQCVLLVSLEHWNFQPWVSLRFVHGIRGIMHKFYGLETVRKFRDRTLGTTTKISCNIHRVASLYLKKWFFQEH